MTIDPALISLAAACLYMLGCVKFGYAFPFDAYRLYCDTARRRTSATPIFLAEGLVADPSDFHQFSGFEGVDFLPSTMPTGLSWLAHETGRWITENQADGTVGTVQVQYGFFEFSIMPCGSVKKSLVVLYEGIACRR